MKDSLQKTTLLALCAASLAAFSASGGTAQAAPAASAAAPAAQALPDALERAARRFGVDPAHVVVSVVPLDAPGRPVLAWRDAVLEKPASAAKLVTTLAGLEVLGAHWRWHTGFYSRVKPDARGLLKGALHIRGSGDPTFVVEAFELELERLAQLGVKRIEGDVVLDRSAFTIPAAGPGAFDGRATRPYNLPPDPVLVNYRNLSFEMIPDPEAGVARVVAVPKLAGVTYPKTIRLGRGACGDWKSAIGFKLLELKGGGKKAVFTGRLPAACGPKTFNTIAMGADEYFERLFRAYWERDGRTWRGRVKTGPVPADAERLASHFSRTLAETTALTNKWSNNTMARTILLTLGVKRVRDAWEEAREGKATLPEKPASKAAQKSDQEVRKKGLEFPPAATIEDGRAALADWLVSRGLPAQELRIDNGSGLSRDARVTGRAMTKLLVAGWQGPYMPEYLASLPITGRDGTMARRKVAEERGRIKTGYLADVRSIGGYVQAASGRRYAVYAGVDGGKSVPGGIAFLNALIDWVYALE